MRIRISVKRWLSSSKCEALILQYYKKVTPSWFVIMNSSHPALCADFFKGFSRESCQLKVSLFYASILRQKFNYFTADDLLSVCRHKCILPSSSWCTRTECSHRFQSRPSGCWCHHLSEARGHPLAGRLLKTASKILRNWRISTGGLPMLL